MLQLGTVDVMSILYFDLTKTRPVADLLNVVFK